MELNIQYVKILEKTKKDVGYDWEINIGAQNKAKKTLNENKTRKSNV